MSTPTETPKSTTPTKVSFTIRESAHKLGVSEMYLRKMILEGKIPTKQVYVTERMWRHEIAEADLIAFKARTSNRSSRTDGRNKFVVYMSKSEETAVRGLFKSNKLEAVEKLLQRANPGTKPSKE